MFSRGALICLGLILGISLCEGILRIMGYRGEPRVPMATPDDLLGWVGTPRAEGNVGKACFHSSVALNSQGFRDKEHSLKKPEGIFRIAVIGDSFVEADEIPPDKTFCSVLQRRLDLLAPGEYEVMAFGSLGYGTTQEYLLLRDKILQYSPDLVILAFFNGNDVTNVSLPMSRVANVQDNCEMVRTPFYVRDGGRFKLIYFPPDRTPRMSFVSKYIKPVFRSLVLYKIAYKARGISVGMMSRIARGGTLLPSRELPVEYTVYEDPPPPEVQEAWDVVRFAIGAMKDIAQKNNCRFAVVTIPHAIEIMPDELASVQASFPETRDMKWDLKGPDKIMGDILDKEGVPHMFLSSTFLKKLRGGERPYWTCDIHWNATGHMWAGEAIYKFLVEKGLAARETH